MTAERVSPHNLEAERSVLGGVLVENEVIGIVAGILQPRMFFRDAHQRIYACMIGMADKQQPIDLVTLCEALRAAQDLEPAGGSAYVASLGDGVPRSSNVEYYARIVREKYTLRELIRSSTKAVSDAYLADQDAAAVIESAQQALMDLGAQTARGEFVLADDWARELYGAIEHATQQKRVITGVPTSLPTLDRFTRGFQAADLIYLGARPSVGKTALMMQMASLAAETTMAGVVSLEMKRLVVGLRLVAMEARVDLYRLMTGHLPPHEQERVGAALERISHKKLAVDDASGINSVQLRAKVRRLSARYGLGIVFIDYMQLIQGAQKAENRNLELSGISAGLKAMAKDLDVPVVVLSQLSRDAAKGNRRPMLSDLRDSGSLEQDADVVLLLHRPGQHDDGQRYGENEEAELIIAKQRNGPTGTIKLRWIGEQVRFGETEMTQTERTA